MVCKWTSENILSNFADIVVERLTLSCNSLSDATATTALLIVDGVVCVAPTTTIITTNKMRPTHFVSEIHSWFIRKPAINLSLHSGKKSEINPHLLKENFHELQSYYSNYEHINTDGSNYEDKVRRAAAKYDNCKQMHIPDGSLVFTAEAKAIDLALDFGKTCSYSDKFVIFSDTLSVLQALNHTS